jgi:hypothetical protein
MQELEKQVAAVYGALPEQDRLKAAILAESYGESAAIDFFGHSDGLPLVIGGGNQYYLWGPRGADGSVMIVVNGDPDGVQRATICGWRVHLACSSRCPMSATGRSWSATVCAAICSRHGRIFSGTSDELGRTLA